MSHDFHSPRNSRVNVIQGKSRQRTKHDRERIGQLPIQTKPIAEEPNGDNGSDRDDDALQECQPNREAK